MLNVRNDKAEADTVALAGQTGRITIATNMAGRGTDIKLAAEVKEHGGLHVILTEFHESARVDRQLFGRSARQGQPGTVEAFVSLEDDLFARFAPLFLGMVKRISDQQGAVNPMLLRLLVSYAQIIAERHNAGIRIPTLKQDRKLQSLLAFSGIPN